MSPGDMTTKCLAGLIVGIVLVSGYVRLWWRYSWPRQDRVAQQEHSTYRRRVDKCIIPSSQEARSVISQDVPRASSPTLGIFEGARYEGRY
jgi:hypothetical protein